MFFFLITRQEVTGNRVREKINKKSYLKPENWINDISDPLQLFYMFLSLHHKVNLTPSRSVHCNPHFLQENGKSTPY